MHSGTSAECGVSQVLSKQTTLEIETLLGSAATTTGSATWEHSRQPKEPTHDWGMSCSPSDSHTLRLQGKMDAEYNSFLAEMGVAPPPGSGGGGGGDRLRPGLGSGPPGSRMRPGDELPDNCKLYVAGLGPQVDDNMLRVRLSLCVCVCVSQVAQKLGLGSRPPGSKTWPGNELSDDRKLYVAGLGPQVDSHILCPALADICCQPGQEPADSWGLAATSAASLQLPSGHWPPLQLTATWQSMRSEPACWLEQGPTLPL